MPLCPYCKEEIAEGAIYCKHCHKYLVGRKRPIGVTIIAVLTLFGATVNLFGYLMSEDQQDILLGIHMPFEAMIIYYLNSLRSANVLWDWTFRLKRFGSKDIYRSKHIPSS